MSNNAKDLRKQVRNVVAEILPEILKEELFKAIEKRVTELTNARLNAIDERQKDIQHYMVRNSASPVTSMKSS